MATFASIAAFTTIVLGNVNAFMPRQANLHISTSHLNTETRSSLALNVWGVQKIGQSVINRNTTAQVVTTDETGVLRFRPSVGTGADERMLDSQLSSTEEDYVLLTNLEINHEKRDLLQGLTGTTWSPVYKMSMIGAAAAADDLLPKAFSVSSSPSLSNIKAGGLMTDWNME
mmetsp:Transcript_25188/g.25397  ORF Transcript_25188/g.25397 Transcript_25188/m.25397 type:complete len:172 (+) Transcript_25188:149-664(+)|eukprot:CAMPEP_0182418514 /NCGR_PEP_ID=MMETSP1167-20130531/2924_1 /TAXON_ID=2988 /ORGANISM="Mallomonas Sp, Strain CCMP3275" /LENGTH=171 /DNA_ID=CAMNT_0024592755 /DNA_START=144 /DNA_END=659 /DNA_ORIENTATION=+